MFEFLLEYKYNFTGPNDNGHLARQSNDIVIAFVKQLSRKTVAGKALKYKIHDGKTGVLIRASAAFGETPVAHEVGHVLGASHGKLKKW